jgi:hypothetical protein
MSRQQKRVFFTLLFLGGLYFILFIFPNATGAKNANMLQVFEVDEYAQYPNLISMLTPGPTFYQSIRNFLVYLHYFYGYPFYFFSALVVLPVKLILGANWVVQTQTLVLVLRQMINVFPAIVAVLLLTYLHTRFKSMLQAVLLFVFLLSIPGMTVNNLWWHLDSLGILFVALTLFFLDRDNLRFGKNFTIAAVMCGVAFGIKYLGFFYVLAVPLYIIWGIAAGKIKAGRAALMAGLFLLVMAAAVLVSNPLLLAPQERAAIIANQELQFQQTTSGILLRNLQPFLSWGNYPEDFRLHYGEWFFFLFGVGALVYGFRKSGARLNALTLAWFLPFAVSIINSGTRRTHYFLPGILLLYACLAIFLPGSEFWINSQTYGWKNWRRILPWVFGALMLFQFVLFVKEDVVTISSQLTREQTSPSLAFTSKFDNDVLSRLGSEKLLAYRDWHMYLPSHPGLLVDINWDLATPAYIADMNPDIILLERANVDLVNAPGVIANAANPGNMKQMQEFYSAAGADKLPGYRVVEQDKFGLALLRESLYNRYIK